MALAVSQQVVPSRLTPIYHVSGFIFIINNLGQIAIWLQSCNLITADGSYLKRENGCE